MRDKLLFINRYTAIIRQNDKYIFEIDGQLAIRNEGITLNEAMEKSLHQMLGGKGFTQSELQTVWGEKTIDFFVKNSVLLGKQQDLDQIQSRTDAYFQFEHIPNGTEFLKQKKVMILGCGGIGTHVAWNLASLGMGGLVLVDFDTVEMSNLNRQLLYDISDVGKNKVDVLKDKLSLITTSAEIEAVNIKISDEGQLEELCRNSACDLIVKSIDSPEDFPTWLDHVCERLKINYISGTLTGTYFVVGPTYIAGEKSAGYSDIFPRSADYKIISGTRPSLSCQVSEAASLIAAEACRVLFKFKNLKYKNQVHFENPIRRTTMDVIAEGKDIEPDEDKKLMKNKGLLVFAMNFLMLFLLFRNNLFFWAGGIFLVIGSVIIFTIPSRVAMATAINTIQYYIVGFFVMIISNRLLMSGDGIVVSIATLFYVFIVYSLMVWLSTLLAYILSYIKTKLKSQVQAKRRVKHGV